MHAEGIDILFQWIKYLRNRKEIDKINSKEFQIATSILEKRYITKKELLQHKGKIDSILYEAIRRTTESNGSLEYKVKNGIVNQITTNDAKGNIQYELDLKEHGYFLATAHRQENVDNKNRFDGILKGLKILEEEYNIPVVYPIHPRARKKMQGFNLNSNSIRLIEPIDFLSFLQLEKNARLVLTDSGGVQEETCILGVFCVTLRDTTERPETIEVGSNILAGVKQNKILSCTRQMYSTKNSWKNPFGNGKAGEKIIEILQDYQK